MEIAKVSKKNTPQKKRTVIRQATLPLHVMLIPGIFLVLVFNYSTMLGVIIAFQDFDATRADGTLLSIFFSSKWASNNGMGNFLHVVQNADAVRAIINTITIALMKMVTMFFSPIILSLLLNEIKKQFIKAGIQTIIYMPHFLSWVILGGIIAQLMSMNGVFNNIFANFHYISPQADLTNLGATLNEFKRTSFMEQASIFQPIVIVSNIWKEIGWSTIIYLAAISGVDPTLYEAAVMDGANKLKQVWHITLPGMTPIIVLLLVLSLGGIFNAGFDQIFNLINITTYSTGDIIDTFVYRISFRDNNWALGAAVGLFRSVISLVLISVSYFLAFKFAKYEIF